MWGSAHLNAYLPARAPMCALARVKAVRAGRQAWMPMWLSHACGWRPLCCARCTRAWQRCVAAARACAYERCSPHAPATVPRAPAGGGVGVARLRHRRGARLKGVCVPAAQVHRLLAQRRRPAHHAGGGRRRRGAHGAARTRTYTRLARGAPPGTGARRMHVRVHMHVCLRAGWFAAPSSTAASRTAQSVVLSCPARALLRVVRPEARLHEAGTRFCCRDGATSVESPRLYPDLITPT